MKINLAPREAGNVKDVPRVKQKPSSVRYSIIILLGLQVLGVGAVYAYYVDSGQQYLNPVSHVVSQSWDRFSDGLDATGLTTATEVISRGLWQSLFGESPDVIYLQVPHTSVMALDAARRQKLEVGSDDVYNQDHNWGNKYQKAKMIVNGEEYKIKMRNSYGVKMRI